MEEHLATFTLVDLYSAISKGEIPTQQALSAALYHAKTLLEAQEKDKSMLDETGRKITTDLRKFIEAAENLAAKNKDHNLEKLIEHGKSAALEMQKQIEAMKASLGDAAEMIRNRWSRSWEDVRTLLLETMSSSEFREIIMDFVRASYNLLTGSLAEKGQEWAKEVAASSVAKEPSAPQPKGRGRKAKGTKRKQAEEAILQSIAAYTPLSAEELKKGRDQLFAALERFSHSPSHRRAIEGGLRMLEDLWQIAGAMRKEYEPVAKKATAAAEKTAKRAKRGAEKIAGEAEKAKEEAMEISEEVQEAMHKLASNKNLHKMFRDAKELVEKFIGPGKVDTIVEDFNNLFEILSDQPDILRNLMEFGGFILDSLKDPALLKKTEHLERLASLLEAGRKAFFQIRAIPVMAKFLWDVMDGINTIKSDPALAGLAQASQALMADLFVTAEGAVSLRPDLLSSMRNLVVSLVIQELKTITVDKIEGSSDKYDYRIEDLKLTGHDLLPDHIHVKVESDLDFSAPQLHTERAKANITIKATRIKTHMENVKFWFRRKGLLLDVTDEGIAAVALKGEGASLTIRLKMDAMRLPSEPLFRVKDVQCDLDTLHVHIMESKFDIIPAIVLLASLTLASWILNILSPILSGRLKCLLEKAVEEGIRTAAEKFERELSRLIESSPSAEKLTAALKERLGSATEAASAAVANVTSTIVS